MRKVGLITNVNSGGNKKGFDAVRQVIASHSNVIHHMVKSHSDMGEAVAQLKQSQIDCLVINGGDGSVQSILTHWLQQPAASKQPSVAVLRSGTASLVARSLGIKGMPEQGLKRLLLWSTHSGGHRLHSQRKAVLRIKFPDQQPDVYGLFVGAAGISQGIEYFHKKSFGHRMRGPLLPGITFLRMIVSDFIAHKDNVLHPIPVMLQYDEHPELHSDSICVLVTSLDKLFFGTKLYWGTQQKPLHLTHVRPAANKLVRSLPNILRGRATSNFTFENGYLSENVENITIKLPGRLTVDGEFFHYQNAEQAVKISVGDYFEFLTDY